MTSIYSFIRRVLLILLTATAGCASASTVRTGAPTAGRAESQPRYTAINTDFFGEPMFFDSVHHYQMSMVPEARNYERFAPEQLESISGNLVLLQNSDGGWPKNLDWFKAPVGTSRDDQIRSLQRKPNAPSTLDNRNTWSQLIYLMRVYEQWPDESIKTSFEKGVAYIIKQQHKFSRGWRGADVDAVTYNDDVMAGVLYFLKEALQGNYRLTQGLDDALRSKLRASFDGGLQCVLKTQVRMNGTRTVWGQQHDHSSLSPIPARSFEPAALASLESVNVVRILMSLENPSPEVREAIHGAIAWFNGSRIYGVRVETIDAPPVRFPHRFSDKDRVAVKDPGAPPIWARFYDLQTNSPVFSNRNSAILKDFNNIPRERREGYNWYGYWPADLLAVDYTAWTQRNPSPP